MCSEKSYCNLCMHCEKKICEDCKSAHMDILRREINRINNQIRRGVHRLQDILGEFQEFSMIKDEIRVLLSFQLSLRKTL